MKSVRDLVAELPPSERLTRADVRTLLEELAEYQARFAPLFVRREQREWAEVYLRGLLGADVPRKNVEAMALRLLGAGPGAERRVRALQQFIGEGTWDDAALLAEHQRLVDETLGEDDGVLILDGSDFPKQGSHSVGVARQWCGATGKKDNCQAGVFLGYTSRQGATLLDRRLYLPETWFAADSRARWEACRIPAGTEFRTKHELAGEMVEALMAQQPRLRTRWVVCDEGYGDAPALLDRLAATGLWYLAEIPCDTQVWPLTQADGQTARPRPQTWVPPQRASRKGPVPRQPHLHPESPGKIRVDAIAQQWPAGAWQRYRLLEGRKGPLVADLLALRVVSVREKLPGPEVWLVIRRKVSGPAEAPEWKFYLSNAPQATPLAAFARVSGMRWPIETCFEDAKGDLGMDHYELRFWRGWHHHMTLVILAHHFLVRWQRRLAQREGALAQQPGTGSADGSLPRPVDPHPSDRPEPDPSASAVAGHLAAAAPRRPSGAGPACLPATAQARGLPFAS
jgi:SRSO17 transposase